MKSLNTKRTVEYHHLLQVENSFNKKYVISFSQKIFRSVIFVITILLPWTLYKKVGNLNISSLLRWKS